MAYPTYSERIRHDEKFSAAQRQKQIIEQVGAMGELARSTAAQP